MIRSAYCDSAIDEHTKILFYLRSLFDKNRLPQEYASVSPIKSGTTAVEEIYRYIRKRNARRDIVKAAIRYLSAYIPDLRESYTSRSGYFTIHYSTSGPHAVPAADINGNGVPDYVEFAGECLDYSRELTCNTRGFRYPVSEAGGGKFDIYLMDLQGKYGITFPSRYHNTKNIGQRIASCYISMDNSYSSDKGFKKKWDDCMRVTAAHEFFHAVQNAYNVDADSWWKEASATWNEDEAYDGVNDYFQYLDRVFSYPEKPLENSSYGGVVFAKYISENYGGYQMIRRIWEKQYSSYRNSINAIDAAIAEAYPEKGIGSVYNEFTACNYNPAQYYREGSQWKISAAVQNTYEKYPVSSGDGRLSHLSAHYKVFKPASPRYRTLKLSINGSKNVKWGFKLLKRRRSDDMCEEIYIPCKDDSGVYEISCGSFGETYKEVCLIPANLDKEYDNAGYTYSAFVE